jgi:hypothetical protein
MYTIANVSHHLSDKTESMCDISTLCCVTVQGVYPTLTVQDIRATGSAETYSKVQLWNLFSLERSVLMYFIYSKPVFYQANSPLSGKPALPAVFMTRDKIWIALMPGFHIVVKIESRTFLTAEPKIQYS